MTARGKTAKKRAQALGKVQKRIAAQKKKASAAQAKKKSTVNQPLTKAQKAAFAAKAALDEEQRAETTACWAKLQEVLKKHGCHLHARPQVVPRSDGLFVLGAEVLISKAPLKLPAEPPDDDE